ncbi:MAG: ABC transporter ATP-binding protein [Arenicella sp.]
MFEFFEKIITPFPTDEPQQPPKTLWAFCRYYTRGAEVSLGLMALLTGLLAVFEVSLFGFMGQLVDWLGTKSPETLYVEERGTLLWMAFIILVAIPLTVLLHALLIHQTLYGNYPSAIRWQVHRYLLGQSMAFYQNELAGRIATKVQQTSLSIRETVMKVLDVLLFVGVYFGGIVVLVASSDWRLTAPLLLWLLGYLGTLRFFLPRLRRLSVKNSDARSVLTGRLVDSYTNISTLKLFSHSKRESEYARESMQLVLDTLNPLMRVVTRMQVVIWMLNSLLIFSISGLSIYLWTQDAVSTGAIAIAISLPLRLNGMSQWIMWEVASLFEHIGTVQDGMRTIAQPRDVLDQPKAPKLQVTQGEIVFDHVGFHYEKESGVIDDLSLTVNAGEKIGLVGRSGAGKSTLVNLLLRFHDIEHGSISIDGQSIDKIQQDSLRAEIGMVAQETSLLHRSVRDNILYGKPDANEDEMLFAAQQAEAHEFILDLSDPKGRTGYDAHVGERGVKLSGGQRQRIAIARVLLKNAPILVLDEATSALDSEVEASIQKSLYKLMQGKTVIAIAHRLSTIAAMDRLIVLDKGNIVEQGTHQELIKTGGVYAQLWSRQSGGFLGS